MRDAGPETTRRDSPLRERRERGESRAVEVLTVHAESSQTAHDWSSDRILIGSWSCDLAWPGRRVAHASAGFSLGLEGRWQKLTYATTEARPTSRRRKRVTTRSQSSKPIYPPTFFLVAVTLMVCLHFLAPARQVILPPYRWLGVVPIAGGVAMVLWVAGIFRRAGTTIKPFQESTELITGGPYRVTRNPIYLGMVCALVGVAVVAGSLTPFLVVPLFAWLIDRRFIRAEEAMLEQTFGARFAAYKARVRRWL